MTARKLTAIWMSAWMRLLMLRIFVVSNTRGFLADVRTIWRLR